MDAREATVRETIAADHAATIAGVCDCADDVASGWDAPAVADRRAVVDPLARCLEDRDLLSALADALRSGVEAGGWNLDREIVAGPPYVVVTSRGPVCRVTLEAARLVVRVEVFEIRRGVETRYARRTDGKAELSVSLRDGQR